MNFLSALLPSIFIVLLFLSTSVSAQRGGFSTQNGAPISPGPSLQAPSDASLTSQGGMLVDVVGENRRPLDRQAVVKASNKQTQNVVYATTGGEAEAALGALSVGTYQIEVSAVGYLTSTVEVKIPDAHVVYKVHVDLQKDPSAIDLNVSTRDEMPVKVRKQMSQGVAALKSGKFKQAQKHLEAADAAFPYNSEIKFLLGYLFFQEKDFKQAETYLTDACKFDSHNVQAMTLLGRTQLKQQEYESAKKTLEQAIAVDPEYWMAHNLLAETYLKLQEYDKAREQAQIAIEKGKGAGSSAHIALGQALENLGRDQEALDAYRTFVKESPSNPMAGEVRTMFDELRRRMMSPTPVAKAAASRGTDILLASNDAGFSMKAWGPPGIDDVKQPVAEGVACPYDKVIDGAGERIKQLVDDVGRFNAIEDLLHEDLDQLDHPITRTVLKFNYVASISEPRPGVFNVGEFRDQRSGAEDFPDQIATRGLPALALIFHPDERDDFKMACEGLGDWRGHATWLVRFEQRTDRRPRIQEYRIAGRSYPVSLKGRAWISADSFHLLHVESDLVSPMPEIQLLSEHMAVDYAPQLFQKKSVELWLPKSAEIYFDFRRHHYLRRHSFDHFMLFSVDSEENRSEPRASKELPNAPVSQ